LRASNISLGVNYKWHRVATRRQPFRAALIFNLGIDFLHHFLVISTSGKIFFEFVVLSQIVTTRDVNGQSCQLFWRQAINSLLDFRQTRRGILTSK